MNNTTLFTEAFDNFVTFGDVRTYFNDTGSLAGFTKTLSNDYVFSFEEKFIKKLSDFIQAKIEDSNIKDTDILFTLDPKIKRFKIPTRFEQELNIPMTLFKILDSRFSGFTSKNSLTSKSTVSAVGYNQGDIDEFLLGLGILTYFSCDHKDQVIPLVQKALIALNDGVFSYRKDEITFVMQVKLKYPQIINYLSDLKPDQLQTLFHKVETFVNESYGGWREIKQQIVNGTTGKDSTVSIISAGASDSKMDKSDWILKVESEEDGKKSSSIHGISVKSNNKTFHRFSCLNLLSVLDFLELFKIELSDVSNASLKRRITSLKSKLKTADNRKSLELLKEGKELCLFIEKFIIEKFNKLSFKEKIENFVLSPVFNAVKGLDKNTHVIPFTISDIKKGVSFRLDSTESKLDVSNEDLIKEWTKLGKRLSLKRSFDPDGYPALYLFSNDNEIYRIRFTKSHLSSNSPKITGMFEIVDFSVLRGLIAIVTGDSE